MTARDPIVISSGHGKYIRGASGYIDEVDEARKVVERVAQILKDGGVSVKTFHDNTSHDQNTNLHAIVNYHNAQQRDLDVSIHFNAYQTTSNPMGVECLYVTQQTLADNVSAEIAHAGDFIDRGPKYRSDLYFLNNTSKPAILVETCFVDSKADSDLYHKHFEDICHALAETIAGKALGGSEPAPEPPPIGERPPDAPPAYPTIKKGSVGPDVVILQRALGVLPADGDFGSITDTWVRAFQAASGLSVDGIVGPLTWEEVDALQLRVDTGLLPLPPELVDEIATLAKTSEMFDYSWPDRGVAPEGYISGMCLAFAHAISGESNDDAVAVMSRAAGNPDKDALAWYAAEFKKLGMSNAVPGVDTLRHLFVMMTGLGPRESSGRYFEGRDMSASNVESDTCEAGLFQTSWNIRNANSTIAPLLNQFWKNPNGFLPEFKIGLSPSANNLNSYGSGDGIKYQFLSRFCPLFHVMVTGVGMRTLRAHWGPIGRREVTLKREMDDLLKSVQELVAGVA